MFRISKVSALATTLCVVTPIWAANNNGWDTDLIYGPATVAGGSNSDGGAATTADYVAPLSATTGTTTGSQTSTIIFVNNGSGGNATYAGLAEGDTIKFGAGTTKTIKALLDPGSAEATTAGSSTGVIILTSSVTVSPGQSISLVTNTVGVVMTKSVLYPGEATVDTHFGWAPMQIGTHVPPVHQTGFNDPGHQAMTLCFSGRGSNDARMWRANPTGSRTAGQGFTVSEYEGGTGYELRRASIGQVLGGADLFLNKGDVGCLRYNARNDTLILSFTGRMNDATLLDASHLNRAADTEKQFYAVEFELSNCALVAPDVPLVASAVVQGAQNDTRRVHLDDGAGGVANFSQFLVGRRIRFNPSGQTRFVVKTVTQANTGYTYPGNGILVLDRPVTLADNETISRWSNSSVAQADGATLCTPALRELYEGPKNPNSPSQVFQGPGTDVDENGILYMVSEAMDVDSPGNFGGPDVVSFDTSVVGATGGLLSSNVSSFPSNIPTNLLTGIFKRLIDGAHANGCDNPVVSQITCNYKQPRMLAWRPPPTSNGAGLNGNLVSAIYNWGAVQLKRPFEFDLDAIDANSDLIMLGTVEGDHGEKGIGNGSGSKKLDNSNRLAIRGQRTSWGGVLVACERNSLGGQKIYWPDGNIVRYQWYGIQTSDNSGLWDMAVPWGSSTPPDFTTACCQPGKAGCSDGPKSTCLSPNHTQLDGQTCLLQLLNGTEDGEIQPGCDLLCFANHADTDGDGHVDMNDFGVFQRCYSGSGVPVPSLPFCLCFDHGSDAPNGDNDIDRFDFDAFTACSTPAGGHGAGTPPPNCP